jgi:hypothetical protein
VVGALDLGTKEANKGLYTSETHHDNPIRYLNNPIHPHSTPPGGVLVICMGGHEMSALPLTIGPNLGWLTLGSPDLAQWILEMKAECIAGLVAFSD